MGGEIRCGPGSAQTEWLKEDLGANAGEGSALWPTCTTRFSSGVKHGGTSTMEPLWEALYEAGAEVVLSGHEHNYERFAPQAPRGGQTPSAASGSSLWAVGEVSHYPIFDTLPNSEVHNDESYGVLKLTLSPKLRVAFYPRGGRDLRRLRKRPVPLSATQSSGRRDRFK